MAWNLLTKQEVAGRFFGTPDSAGLRNLPKKKKNTLSKKLRRKASQDEIQDRRKQVLRMRLQGHGYRSIAEKLEIGHMTVKRDLEVIRQENRQKVTQFERDGLLAETISVYENVEAEAWLQYRSGGTNAAQKARFLDVVRAARGDQVKLMTELGFLQKAPAQVQHMVKADVISHWTPEAQDLVALALVRGMTTPAAEPTREVIDVPTPRELAAGGGGNGVNQRLTEACDE